MKTVKFVWTPVPAGISGNEKADEGAKQALRQCLPSQSTVVAADMIEQNLTQKKILSNKLGNNPRAALKKTIERWKPKVKLNIHQLWWCSLDCECVILTSSTHTI
jgi:hypothetical protein